MKTVLNWVVAISLAVILVSLAMILLVMAIAFITDTVAVWRENRKKVNQNRE